MHGSGSVAPYGVLFSSKYFQTILFLDWMCRIDTQGTDKHRNLQAVIDQCHFGSLVQTDHDEEEDVYRKCKVIRYLNVFQGNEVSVQAVKTNTDTVEMYAPSGLLKRE